MVGDGDGGSELHGGSDAARPCVKRPPEDAGEAEDIVDLVRKIAAPGAHDGGTAPEGFFGHDFRDGIGKGENDGVGRHRADVGGNEQFLHADADEHVCPDEGIFQISFAVFEVGVPGDFPFGGVEVGAVFVDDALRVAQYHVFVEDRLEATSEDLKTAEATVEQQQAVLSEAGLAEGAEGARSAVGTFLQQVDVSGLVAASYNHRLLGGGDKNLSIGNSFRHRNANSFSLDQLWLAIDKPVNEESRGGFHTDLLYGESARALRNSIVGSPLSDDAVVDEDGTDDFYLFSAYASYLAPIGNGVRFDLGKRDTLMGVERIKTNVNYNITQGRVFGLIPIVNTGLLAETQLTDQVSIAAGVFNDVYADTSIDDSRHKAYFSQIAYKGDSFGFKVDSIVGKNSASGLQSDPFPNGVDDCDGGQTCQTAVLDAVATAQLSESLEAWFQFVWSRHFGSSILREGDTHAFATAARFHVTEDTSFATRVEYLRAENNYNIAQGGGIGDGYSELVTATVTGAHALTDALMLRAELRYDQNLTQNVGPFAIDNSGTGDSGTRNHQLLGIAELYYEF